MVIEKLKNIAIITIGVVILVGFYFQFSPYQNCVRHFAPSLIDRVSQMGTANTPKIGRDICKLYTSW